jgi:hypothetical protein
MDNPRVNSWVADGAIPFRDFHHKNPRDFSEASEKRIEALEVDLVSKKEITNKQKSRNGDSNAWKSITGLRSHRNERGFFPALFNPTEQQLERVGKELAECRSCRNAVARRDCSSTTVQAWNDSET